MVLTLKQLNYLVALAQERHFGRAAEKVHVTQPALSMQIRDLEDHLGCTLVERGRDIRLTPAGRNVAQRAAHILADVAEIEALARRQALGSHLHIGFIPTLAPYLLPTLLPTLTMKLRIHEAQTQTLLTKLEDGSLDAIVIASPAIGDFCEIDLFEDRFLLAGNANRIQHLSDRVEDLRPVHLDPDHLLLLDEGHCLADQALAACGLQRGRSRVDLAASSLATLSGLAARGMGLTFLPEIAAHVELSAQPDLRLARFADPQPSRRIILAGRQATASETWFSDLAAHIVNTARAITARPSADRPVDR